MKLNNKGIEMYKIWEQKYYKENDNLGGDSANGNFVEGWVIIDNYDYVKTLEDECGLMVFGYDDDAIDVVDEWIDLYGENDFIFTDYYGNKYTCREVKEALLKYFEAE